MITTYTVTPRGIIRDRDGAVIPPDPDNMDYRDYLSTLPGG